MKTESLDQQAVVHFLRVKYPEVLFNISPANCINPRQGIYNKRMGLQAGCPDLMIFHPRPGSAGLFIELKRQELRDFTGKIFQAKGKPSTEQLTWIEKLNKLGYRAVVCYGSEEAIKEIQNYMGEKC